MSAVATRSTRGGASERSSRRWAAAAFLGPGALYLSIFFVLPLGLIVSYAFLTRGRFGGVVPEVTLENFARLFEPVYLQVIGTSIGTAAITTTLALLLGFPTAYVISRLPRRWRVTALILVLLPFWTNFLIRTYAWIILLNDAGWINGALQGLGIVDDPIRMLYTQPAVITGLLYIYLPLMILPLYSAIERIDPALEEAATNLGASRWRVFRTITIPLALPGMLIGSVFVFVPSMANFVIPELIGGGKSLLLGNLIRDQFLKARDWPFGAALALVLTAILVILLVLQARAAARAEGGGARAHS